jgi:hypothetical protein
MKTLIACLALALVVTLAPAATAAPQPEGTNAKASLYAQVLDTGNRRIQVLRRTCTNPSEQHGCLPIRLHLRHAIARAVDRPILWVGERRRHAGVFWVLGPVRFGDGRAWIRSAWREPGRFGCSGSNNDRFRWTNDRWNHTGGSGSVGCPRIPVGSR